MNKEVVKCFNCSNMNEVKISSGHSKPENKGRKYFTCANCNQFQWVENGVAVSNSGFTKIDYTKTAKPQPQAPATPQNGFKERDYDAENRGKCRHGLLVARTQLVGLVPMTQDEFDALTQLVEISMTGKAPVITEDIGDIDLPSERSNKEQDEINETFRSRAEDPES